MRYAIGIDIGGANTKVASTSGITRSFYLPLWRENDLAGLLRKIRDEFQPEVVGIVITAELTDAFASKTQGVNSIATVVNSIFSKTYYLSVYGKLTKDIAAQDTLQYAASNWVASAIFLAKSVKNCIFTDVGSTTCDVIPIKHGKPIAKKRDFERLQHFELIYAGALRTNIATILSFVKLREQRCKICTELFAITADVHRVLGNLDEADYTCETPDSRSRDFDACCQRISRVLLCDLNELHMENALEVARQVECAQVNELAEALTFHASKHKLHTVIGAGLGEFLVAKAAIKAGLEFQLLSQQYGRAISNVFPAFAVAQLLEKS